MRSQTISAVIPGRFPLCLLTQHSEAFSSSFSLIMLEQPDHVASTASSVRLSLARKMRETQNLGSTTLPLFLLRLLLSYSSSHTVPNC